MVISLVDIVISAILALISAFAGIKLYLTIPASWLCDYNELPGKEHCRDARLFYGYGESVWIFIGSTVCFIGLCGNLFYSHTSYSFKAQIPDLSVLRDLLKLSAVFIILFISTLSDLRYRIIPDQSCISLTGLAILPVIFENGEKATALLNVGIGAAFIGGLMVLAAALSWIFYGSNALGFGDVKLMAACGAVVGGIDAVGVFVIATLSSAIYFISGLLLKRIKADDTHPMAPWIGFATLICISVNI